VSTVEFGLEVGLLFRRAVCENIAVVEALGDALGGDGADNGKK
jgi:hypothetical protein